MRESHLWALKQQPHLHKSRELIAPDNSEGGVQGELRVHRNSEERGLSCSSTDWSTDTRKDFLKAKVLAKEQIPEVVAIAQKE